MAVFVLMVQETSSESTESSDERLFISEERGLTCDSTRIALEELQDNRRCTGISILTKKDTASKNEC